MTHADRLLHKPSHVTVVIFGFGSAGRRQQRVLAAAGARTLVVPARAARAAELRKEGLEAFPSIAEALAQTPDGAVIATDTGRHRDDALACLRGGCDILVEKPLAGTAEDGAAIEAVAQRLGRRAYVACCLRFNPGLLWTRSHLGQLGRIISADIECLSWLPSWRPDQDHRTGYAARPDEGGVLRDLVHEVDAALWLFGPAQVQSATRLNQGVVELPDEVEETAVLQLDHARVASSAIRLSYAVRPSSRRIRVWGEHGCLTWDFIARRAELVGPRGEIRDALRWRDSSGMYDAQARAFLDALRGDQPPASHVCDGRPTSTGFPGPRTSSSSPDVLCTAAEGTDALRILDTARAMAPIRVAKAA